MSRHASLLSRTILIAAAAVALSTSCNERALSPPDASGPGDSSPKLQASVTSGTCPKNTPPGDYVDRPAECVEISGVMTIAPGEHQTLSCLGWGSALHDPRYPDSYLVAAGHPSSWSSDNTQIATVNKLTTDYQATVTGVAPGPTSIWCYIDNAGTSVRVTVTGTRTLQSMFILPNPATLLPGQTQQMREHFVDNYGGTDYVSAPIDQWTSDNPSVATVNNTGVVTAVASAGPNTDGIAYVRARAGTIWSSAAKVIVKPAPHAVSVTVSPASATIVVGQTVTLTASARDQYGNAMTGRIPTWSSSNSGIATVSSGGVVTGAGGGQATISATIDGVSGTATVTVRAVTTVEVSPPSATVHQGWTVTLAATAKDQFGNVMTGKTASWTSSNSNIATVSSAGVVTGVALGQATIYATIDGVSGSSAITVTYPKVAVNITGPTYINTPGSYTWTATPSGGNGSYAYQWEYRDALNPNTWLWAGAGTAVSKYVDRSTANWFIYRVTVTSAGDNSQAAITVQADFGGACNPYC